MSMSKDEIIKALEAAEITVDEFAYGDFNSPVEGIGEIVEVYQEGGENQGSHWESVKHLVDQDMYVKVVGWYSSYSGTDFDSYDNDLRIVTPKEKVITVYE